MPAEHLGELAELYALGTLEPLEAKRVQAHARECAACAARVGEAEAAVSRLMDADEETAGGAELPPLLLGPRRPVVRPASAWAWGVAVGAAFVIGMLVPAVAPRERAAQSAVVQQAASAMLAGHFAHVPLRPLVRGAPKAKVVYPLEGGWVYAIVGGGEAVELMVVRGGSTSAIASLPASANVRTAFARVAGTVDAVELMHRGRIVASGTLAR